MTQTFSKTRTLVECALMIAIGTVLSMIKLVELPNGGSVTLLSMLPFVVVSFRHGVKWGLLTGLANSLLQMLLGFYAPPAGTALAFFGMIMLDYVLAFSLLGTAVVFSKPFKNKLAGVAVGTAAVCIIRFLCSFFSGILIWAAYAPADMPLWLYSLTYNGSYMGIELILTTAGALVLYRAKPALFSAVQDN